jgi:hypothetical protein
VSGRGSVVRLARWLARIWTLGSVAFVLAIFVGELLAPDGPLPTADEWLGLALFPFGVVIGLVVGWWRELAGSLLALLCLGGFYVWEYARSGDLAEGPFFALVALPAVFYLVAWVGSREKRPAWTDSGDRE